MKDKEHSLIYHALHSRPMRGCLPLFFIPAAVIVTLVLLNVEIKPAPELKSEGVARVSLRSDELTAMRMQLRSPLPLLLPVKADPTRREQSNRLPHRSAPTLQEAPMQPVFEGPHTSMLIDDAELLELPPPADEPNTLAPEPAPTAL